MRHSGSADLRRLSDPFWFQSLGAVMGMDWHSSGITMSGLAQRAEEGFIPDGSVQEWIDKERQLRLF